MKLLKKIMISILIILVTISLLWYGGYRLYNYLLEDAMSKIQQRVEVVVKKSSLEMLNPFAWPGKIFGHRKKKKEHKEEKQSQEQAEKTEE